jgi:hypothetical protein
MSYPLWTDVISWLGEYIVAEVSQLPDGEQSGGSREL